MKEKNKKKNKKNKSNATEVREMILASINASPNPGFASKVLRTVIQEALDTGTEDGPYFEVEILAEALGIFMTLAGKRNTDSLRMTEEEATAFLNTAANHAFMVHNSMADRLEAAEREMQ